MRRFITYILLFSGLILLSNLLLVYLTANSIDESAFKLPESTTILVLGDSHLECAVDDSILRGSKNLCNSGEAYVYTYTKMKIFLEQNPHIDTVMLSFNYHSLLGESELWLFDRNGVLNIDRYCCFFDDDERSAFQRSFHFYKSYFRIPYTYRAFLINKLISKQSECDDLRWGGYLSLDKNIQKKDIEKLEKNKSTIEPNEDYKNTSSQLIYLNKIVDYCRNKNICLIFVSTPVVTDFIDKQDKYYDYYIKTYPDIPLWDYAHLLLPDSCYADIHHLNYRGAQVFSNIIDQRRKEPK